MKYYRFQSVIRDSLGISAPVRENSEVLKEVAYYEKRINSKSFFISDVPVQLLLRNWEGESVNLHDYHYWGIGQPNAFHIVCSPKFRKVLESLNLPPHRFYNAKIDVKNKMYNYFVLHFIQDWLKEIDYAQTVFNVVALMDNERVIKRLNVGEVKSFEKYKEIIEMMVEYDQYFYPAKLHFLPHIVYDIWGLQGQIILNERAKKAFELAQITGVDMPELHSIDMFKNIEITMNNQTYYPESQTNTMQYESDLHTVSLVAEPKTPYDKKL